MILYASELNKNKIGLLPLDLLVNTLYLLKDFKENNEKENKNNNNQNGEKKDEIEEFNN